MSESNRAAAANALASCNPNTFDFTKAGAQICSENIDVFAINYGGTKESPVYMRLRHLRLILQGLAIQRELIDVANDRALIERTGDQMKIDLQKANAIYYSIYEAFQNRSRT